MNTSSKPNQTSSSKPTQASLSRPAETIADAARDAVDTVKTVVGGALDSGQVAVQHASDTAKHVAEATTEQVTTFASELEAMTKRNPLGTIVGAFGVGVVLGLFANRLAG
jgi:ElaB/YqjD/DUF883 family membrane-anchored ribosome-binding protein